MGSKKILIIDDEADIREIAKLSLSITKQWDILTAPSGPEGVEVATNNQLDAILLDLIMPITGGLDTLRLLKQNEKTAAIPVVLLTATAKLAMKLEYADLGIKGILTKPFDPGLLGDQLETVLGWSV
ncbi:MAG: response regulator [Leptolyngbyaceae cyanobacterium]